MWGLLFIIGGGLIWAYLSHQGPKEESARIKKYHDKKANRLLPAQSWDDNEWEVAAGALGLTLTETAPPDDFRQAVWWRQGTKDGLAISIALIDTRHTDTRQPPVIELTAKVIPHDPIDPLRLAFAQPTLWTAKYETTLTRRTTPHDPDLRYLFWSAQTEQTIAKTDWIFGFHHQALWKLYQTRYPKGQTPLPTSLEHTAMVCLETNAPPHTQEIRFVTETIPQTSKQITHWIKGILRILKQANNNQEEFREYLHWVMTHIQDPDLFFTFQDELLARYPDHPTSWATLWMDKPEWTLPAPHPLDDETDDTATNDTDPPPAVYIDEVSRRQKEQALIQQLERQVRHKPKDPRTKQALSHAKQSLRPRIALFALLALGWKEHKQAIGMLLQTHPAIPQARHWDLLAKQTRSLPKSDTDTILTVQLNWLQHVNLERISSVSFEAYMALLLQLARTHLSSPQQEALESSLIDCLRYRESNPTHSSTRHQKEDLIHSLAIKGLQEFGTTRSYKRLKRYLRRLHASPTIANQATHAIQAILERTERTKAGRLSVLEPADQQGGLSSLKENNKGQVTILDED